MSTYSTEPVINASLQTQAPRTEIELGDLRLLRPGDHIGWHRYSKPIWHHAILVDVNEKKIRVIHYAASNCPVIDEWINLDDQEGDLFRFGYCSEVESKNPPKVVIQRALSRVGEDRYSLLQNNCGHFATECKTGTAYSAQVKCAEWKMVWKCSSISINGVISLVTSRYIYAKKMCEQTKKAISKYAGKMTQRIGKYSKQIKTCVSLAVESVHGIYDICQIYEKYSEGLITFRDFIGTTTQRVSEGVCGAIGDMVGSTTGGWIGAAIGSAVPVIGTAAGAAVGYFLGTTLLGTAGSIAGTLLGSMVGHWLGNAWF